MENNNNSDYYSASEASWGRLYKSLPSIFFQLDPNMGSEVGKLTSQDLLC